MGLHLINSRKNRIIVCENLNYFWDEEELFDISSMWHEGNTVEEIAEYFKRDPDEVLIALIHLAREDKITRREGGLLLEH
ncbi:hypothetical protein V7122_02390 [Bacillus sp. JJ1532]|uniref:hypothetical protein n=1 Tax=Bacillus sp. JJ1532 TaxID=3122958 RepID=UPI002FFFCFD2